MSVPYEELSGSPSLTLDREGGSGKRIVLVAWNNIKAFATEVFPLGRLGFPFTASMPGYPWLRAQSIDVEPFDPDGMVGNGQKVNVYNKGAKITVSYAPNKTEDAQKSDMGDKPGADEIVFLENEINVSGEYLVWPNQGVRWSNTPGNDANPDGVAVPCGASGGYQRDIQVSEEIRVGIIIPLLEHTITWNYVSKVPWIGIRSCLGKVNRLKWAGALPETMLFTGASASRQTSNFGVKMWKISYKFSEKCINFPANKKGELPIGWNHFLRPLGTRTRWERLLYGPECRSVYDSADFRRIFKGN